MYISHIHVRLCNKASSNKLGPAETDKDLGGQFPKSKENQLQVTWETKQTRLHELAQVPLNTAVKCVAHPQGLTHYLRWLLKIEEPISW